MMISSIFLDISLLFSCCCFSFLFFFFFYFRSSVLFSYSSVFFFVFFLHIFTFFLISVVSMSTQFSSFISFALYKFIITMLFLFLWKFLNFYLFFFFLLFFFSSSSLSSLFLHIPVWRFPQFSLSLPGMVLPAPALYPSLICDQEAHFLIMLKSFQYEMRAIFTENLIHETFYWSNETHMIIHET